MTDSLEQALAQLARDYVAEAPTRIAELRKDLAALEAGERDALDSLRSRFHRLAGSAGSHGIPEVSELGRRSEQWILTHPIAGPDAYGTLLSTIEAIAAAFNLASTRLGVATQVEPSPRHVEFAWHALVLGTTPDRGALLAAPLESAGFTVRVAVAPAEDPEAVPAHADPDLIVVVHEPDGPDPYALANAWTTRRRVRPRAVVLLEPPGGGDRLRAAAAGVDAVFVQGAMETELTEFARALARIGQPPGSVLLVEDDPTAAELIATVLGRANLRVTRCGSVREAEQTIGGMYPDLFLLDIRLPDGDGFTLARYIRHDPRFALTPLIFLTAASGPESHMEALRCGGDDFVAKPAHPQLLTQLVISRIERGRRIREMAHRDGLTGLLNHATLMAELDHAVEAWHRRKDPFAFVMVDLDHFKRVNDRHGHLAGDRVLVHVAHILQQVARASDLLGRYGGDEFGLILPGNTYDGAAAFTDRAREAIAKDPPLDPTGAPMTIHLSAGIAIYPEDGDRASVVVQAADRALYQAKRRGRDRILRAQDVD